MATYTKGDLVKVTLPGKLHGFVGCVLKAVGSDASWVRFNEEVPTLVAAIGRPSGIEESDWDPRRVALMLNCVLAIKQYAADYTDVDDSMINVLPNAGIW